MVRIAILAALLAAALLATDARERTGRLLYDAGLRRVAALVLGGPAWRGAALYEGGAYADAADAFRSAAFPGQLYDLGGALARAGRLKEAAETFDAALARDPNDEDARFNLALVEAMLARKRDGDAADARKAANASASTYKRSNSNAAESDVNSTGEGAAGDRDSGQQANSATASAAQAAGRAGEDPNAAKRKASGSIGVGGGLGREGDASTNVARLPDQPSLHAESIMYKTIYASRQWLETLPDDPGVYVRRRFAQERNARRERGVAAPEMTDAW